MQRKFHFVIATREKQSEINSLPIIKSLKLLSKIYTKYNIIISIETDNTKGLPEVYNNVLQNKELKNYTKDDFVIFCHDDVSIKSIDIFDKIISGNDKYKFDVMGVAGSTMIDFNKNPISWYNSSKPEDRRGMVIHQQDSNSFISCYNTKTNEKVFCLDGVFLVFNKNAFTQLPFDPQFSFHQYDMDISIAAKKIYNLNLGVIPCIIEHQSVGEGINSNEYTEMQKLLVNKWFII